MNITTNQSSAQDVNARDKHVPQEFYTYDILSLYTVETVNDSSSSTRMGLLAQKQIVNLVLLFVGQVLEHFYPA